MEPLYPPEQHSEAQVRAEANFQELNLNKHQHVLLLCACAPTFHNLSYIKIRVGYLARRVSFFGDPGLNRQEPKFRSLQKIL